MPQAEAWRWWSNRQVGLMLAAAVALGAPVIFLLRRPPPTYYLWIDELDPVRHRDERLMVNGCVTRIDRAEHGGFRVLLESPRPRRPARLDARVTGEPPPQLRVGGLLVARGHLDA